MFVFVCSKGIDNYLGELNPQHNWLNKFYSFHFPYVIVVINIIEPIMNAC